MRVVYKYWNVLAKVVGATVFKVFLSTFSKCKFFLWFMITLMEFCYNNFGSELLDDDGDILLLCGPLSLRPADLALHLLQQGGQQLIDWLKCLGVALLC